MSTEPRDTHTPLSEAEKARAAEQARAFDADVRAKADERAREDAEVRSREAFSGNQARAEADARAHLSADDARALANFRARAAEESARQIAADKAGRARLHKATRPAREKVNRLAGVSSDALETTSAAGRSPGDHCSFSGVSATIGEVRAEITRRKGTR